MNEHFAKLNHVSDLDWSRKSPCKSCPFLKTTPFHEGIAAGLPKKIASIETHTFAHSCHMTDNNPHCDGPHNYKGKTQHCAGAIMMMLKTGNGIDLQLPLLKAAEEGLVDLHVMKRRALKDKRVFTLFQMTAAYARWLKSKCKELVYE